MQHFKDYKDIITIENINNLIEKKEEILKENRIINIGNETNIEFINSLPLRPKYFYKNPDNISKRVYFISFGTGAYNKAMFRIFGQALSIRTFTDVIIFNEYSLEDHKDFWKKHCEFITKSNRGYGYWLWKSFIVSEILANINENDILIYADGGCVLNKNGEKRLNEYINIVDNNSSGILGFQLINNFTEAQFTKADLIYEMGAQELLNTRQIIGGVMIIRKCDNSLALINKWREYCEIYHFIDDSPSEINNLSCFRDHRHDQSIFSILCKLNNIYFLADETDGMNNNYPIWAVRQRES